MITALAVLTLAAAETYHFLQWNFDDAYIIFRIARNILSGGGWHFNLGEVHNASTSVLNTVTITLVARVFGDIPFAAHMLGGLWLAITGLVFAELFRQKFAGWVGLGAGLGIVFLLAGNSTWGLETDLFLCLLALFLLSEQRGRTSWYLIGLLTLTRPDAMLIAALRWLRGFWSERALSLAGVAQFLLVLSPWVVYSLFHFHEVFPDTLSNKIWQGHSGYWGTGLVYLKGLEQHLLSAGPFLLTGYALAVPGMYFMLRDRSALLYLATFALLQQAAYILLNVPGYHWYFSVFDGAMVVSAFYAVGSFYALIAAKLTSSTGRNLVEVSLCAVLLIVAGQEVRAAFHDPPARDGRDQSYTMIARTLKAQAIPSGAVAALEVGTFGYFLEDHPIVDLIGLASANPEFVTGKNSDRFFGAPPPTVLFHSPVWTFERALYDDLRFKMMYGPAVPVPDPLIAMQLFLLRPDAHVPSRDEFVAYVKAHYQSFQLETRAEVLHAPPAGEALCILDQVNGQLASTQAFDVPRSALRLAGWAVDRTQSEVPSETYVLLISKDRTYSQKADRKDRPDVAAHLNTAAYRMAGYESEGSVVELPPGQYRVGLAQRRGAAFISCEFPNVLTVTEVSNTR